MTPVRWTGERRNQSELWECLCDCGKTFYTTRQSLVKGQNAAVKGGCQSCGCLRRDRQKAAIVTHGLAKHRVYRTHRDMLRRCNSPTDPNYRKYGAVGVSVCPEWHGTAGFVKFVKDMGLPEPGMSIERKDVYGDYCPGNCCWLLRRLQGRNKRKTIRVIVDGVLVSLAEVAERYGIKYVTLHGRYTSGRYTGGIPVQVVRKQGTA